MKRFVRPLILLSLFTLTISWEVFASLIIPTVHYSFDGDASDVSGNGNNGIITGSPSFVAGEFDQAIFIDNPVGQSPSTQFVTVPHTLDVQGLENSSLTVALKYKTTDTSQQNGRAAGHHPYINFVYNQGNSPNTNMFTSDGTNEYGVATNVKVTDGNWHWQIIVVDRLNGFVNTHIDNSLTSSQQITTLGTIQLNGMTIGAISGNGGPNPTIHHFGARLMSVDDFQMYNLALDNEQINQLVANEPVTMIPEPSTYLLFAVGILGIIGMGWRQRRKLAAKKAA